MSEATNKFIERVLAWRLPDRARLDGPEGDERVLENPPGARHGEIGGSHGGGQEEEHRKERWRVARRKRRWEGREEGSKNARRKRRRTYRGKTKAETETKKENSQTGGKGGLRYRFLAVIQSTMVPYLTPLPPVLTHRCLR